MATTFNRDLIMDLPNSFSFLIESLIRSCSTLMKGVRFSDKPDYILACEDFKKFHREVLSKHNSAVDGFRVKVLNDIYNSNFSHIVDKIIEGDKVKDKFFQDDIEFVHSTKLENGKIIKRILPISVIYKKVTEFIKEHKIKSVHPPQILLGFFSVMYHVAVKLKEEKESLDKISDNMNMLMENIEDLARPPTPPSNSFLQNFNPAQIGEMFSKLGQDPNSNKEMKKVGKKMKDVFESGDIPGGINKLLQEVKEMHANAAREMENPQKEKPDRVSIKKDDSSDDEDDEDDEDELSILSLEKDESSEDDEEAEEQS